MEEDYYGGTTAAESEPSQTSEDAPQKTDEQTTLIPRSMFPSDQSIDIGSQWYFTVVKDHGEEIEVKYSKEAPKDEKKSDDMTASESFDKTYPQEEGA